MSSSAPADFRFGIEIEVLCKSLEEPKQKWDPAAEELSDALKAAGLENEVLLISPQVDKYEIWKVKREPQIYDEEKEPTRLDMELNSPIFKFRETHVWEPQLRTIWKVLSTEFDTTTSKECGTHVHVSPAEGAWTLEQLKKLAKAVVYYERCVDSLLPPDRRINSFCSSNRCNPLFVTKDSMAGAFSLIDQVEATNPDDYEEVRNKILKVVFLMCSLVPSPYGDTIIGQTWQCLRWNFTDISRACGKGTVEFRQPPGSANYNDAHLWITFTRAYVQGAMLSSIDPSEPATLESFKAFLLNGARSSGVQDTSALTQLFEGKDLLPPAEINIQYLQGKYDPTKRAKPKQVAKLEEKAKQMGITVEQAMETYGYV